MDRKEFFKNCDTMYNLMKVVNTHESAVYLGESFKREMQKLDNDSQDAELTRGSIEHNEFNSNVPKYKKLVQQILKSKETLNKELSKLRMTGRTAGNLITYLSYEPQMKKFVIHVDREVNLPVFPEFALPVGNYLSEIVDYSRELNLDRICINTQIFLDDNFLLLTPCTYITLEFEIYWIAKRYEGYTSNFAESMTYRDMTQYYKIMAYNYACTLAKQEPRKIKFNINNIALVLSNMYYYEYIKCGYIGHNYVIQILTLFARMKALQEIMNNKTKYNQLLSLTQYCDVQFFEWINSVTSLADLQDKLNNKFRSITGSMSSNDFMRASLYILHDNSIVTINNHPHKPTADIQTHQLPMSENIRLNTELYTLINNIGIQ